VATALVEEGLFPVSVPETVIRLEAPAGLVIARVAVSQTDNGAALAESVRFSNVPSYLAATDLALRPDGVELCGAASERGALSVDIAFGGAYYGIVDAAELGLRVIGRNVEALTRAGAMITDLLRRDFPIHHPEEPDLSFVYGTIIVDRSPAGSGDGMAEGADWRNVTIFADAEVDRSPCGSGTSALLAQAAGRRRLAIGKEVANASISGAVFRGRLDGETTLGPHPAYETSISGSAYVIGYQTLVVDERDPLGEGFLLR
jgi:trans-L-3-hydroxyproline dehydratase